MVKFRGKSQKGTKSLLANASVTYICISRLKSAKPHLLRRDS